MPSPQHLRVISSRRIHRFFLPPLGMPFQSSEFVWVNPGQEKLSIENIPGDDSLTVVVDPDNFSVEALSAVQGTVWLWFLNPLIQKNFPFMSDAPRLAKLAEESLVKRRDYLEEVIGNGPVSVVVSDQESFDYCARQGYEVQLSPPPVSDAVSTFASSTERVISARASFKRTEYLRQYLEVLPARLVRIDTDSTFESEVSDFPSHWIVLRDSLVSGFPYEAAVAAMAGQTLISEALSPRWGLEPGLDYIEYSTPEELRRIVEHIVRYPLSTQLMARRAKSKSHSFAGSKVFLRLLSGFSQR